MNLKRYIRTSKAFTLVEALAVIVVIGILALISYPIIINMIEKVEKDAFKQSVNGLIKAVANNSSDVDYKETKYKVINGSLYDEKNNKIYTSGGKNENGDIHINKKGDIIVAVNNKKWCGSKAYEDNRVIVSDYDELTCNIDRINIDLPTYSVSPSGDVWAKSKVVTVTYPARQTGFVYQYSIDGGSTWVTVESGTTASYTFTANGNIIARIYDGLIYHTASSFAVTKIDRIAPTINDFNKSIISGNLTLVGKATDSNSGISYYQFSTNGSLTESSSGWTRITNTTAQTTLTKTISGAGKYYFYVKDAAGNMSKSVITITETISLSGPTKTLYEESESINLSGLTLKLDYGDGVVKNINASSYATYTTNTDISKTLRHTITVKYGSNTFTKYTYKYRWYGTIGKDWYYWYGPNNKAVGDVTLSYYNSYLGKEVSNSYYFLSSGVMFRGWRKINGNCLYYLNTNDGENEASLDDSLSYIKKGYEGGALMKNEWIKVRDTVTKIYYLYYVDANGYMLKDWQSIGGYRYYFRPQNIDNVGPEGSMVTGWIQLGSILYYLKPAGFSEWSGPEGSMLYNTTVIIDGKSYNFDSSGACTNPY